MASVGLEDVFRAPHTVADEISRTQFGVGVVACDVTEQRVIFEATFEPPEPFATNGYPTERARIRVTADGTVRTFPATGEPPRTWRHRNDLGDLCLWDPQDPRELRWEWDDGFETYVAIVHRHLVYEEYYRRHRRWPVEEAPHGTGPHRIERLETHWLRMMWRRL